MLNIYVDMDDVVADFSAAAQKIVGHWDQGQERIPEDQWNQLKQYQRLYRSLPLRTGAHELMQWLYGYCKYNPGTGLYFLTAVPRNNDVPWAFHDKLWWANDYFPETPVFFGPYSREKHQRCRPGDILIDDRESNCVKWRAAGGIAYQYTEWPECKQWLEETLK